MKKYIKNTQKIHEKCVRDTWKNINFQRQIKDINGIKIKDIYKKQFKDLLTLDMPHHKPI